MITLCSFIELKLFFTKNTFDEQLHVLVYQPLII